MQPIDPNADVRALAPHRFEATSLTAITWGDRPVWSGRQVAQALAYSDDAEIVRKVSQDWSDELDEGTDYIVARGDELRAIKAAAPDLVDPRAPSLTLLTESGFHLVALLSRQPKARALRRWLADEVLPSIRRTGGYGAPPPPAEPKPKPKRGRPSGPKLLPGALAVHDCMWMLNLDVDCARDLVGYTGFDTPETRAGRLRGVAMQALIGLTGRHFSMRSALVHETARLVGRPVATFEGDPRADCTDQVLLAQLYVLLRSLDEPRLLAATIFVVEHAAAMKAVNLDALVNAGWRFGPQRDVAEEVARLRRELGALTERAAALTA